MRVRMLRVFRMRREERLPSVENGKNRHGGRLWRFVFLEWLRIPVDFMKQGGLQ